MLHKRYFKYFYQNFLCTEKGAVAIGGESTVFLPSSKHSLIAFYDYFELIFALSVNRENKVNFSPYGILVYDNRLYWDFVL